MGRLRREAQRLRNRLTPGALILLYHRVIELPSDPQWLTVSPRHFAEHLEVLQKEYRVLSLSRLTQQLKAGASPACSIVITFDDGYADNLYGAKPLLEQHDIPATVYVATGHLEGKCEFVWDELENILLQPRRLPENLALNVNGNAFSWELGSSSLYTQQDYQRYCSWTVAEAKDPTPRHGLYRQLHQQLRPLPATEQQVVLSELRLWAGVEAVVRPSHRSLSAPELRELNTGGLVEIGAHTLSHPVLAALPPAAQRREIETSKAALEEIVEQAVTSFSYPFGSVEDYTMETVGLVRQAGFSSACSNFPAHVRRGTDPFQLPRYLVRDWDGDTLARSLRSWCNG